MNEERLYSIHDGETVFFVIAMTMQDAIEKWVKHEGFEKGYEPETIITACESRELIR